MKTPAYIRHLEILGLLETTYSAGLRGGIPIGQRFAGYTIGWKIKRAIERDHKIFIRQCYPKEKYIKRRLKSFFKDMNVVISREDPFIIKVNTVKHEP